MLLCWLLVLICGVFIFILGVTIYLVFLGSQPIGPVHVVCLPVDKGSVQIFPSTCCDTLHARIRLTTSLDTSEQHEPAEVMKPAIIPENSRKDDSWPNKT